MLRKLNLKKLLSPPEKKRAYPWWAWALILIMTPVVFFGPGKIMITTSASLDHRFWLKEKVPPVETLRAGDYVSYNRFHPWTDKKKETLMTKRIACLPGQKLRVTTDLNYYCNGRWLGQALKTDSNNRILTHYTDSGTIPAGKFFMTSEHPRSWDSKYYGLVAYSEFEIYVEPIF